MLDFLGYYQIFMLFAVHGIRKRIIPVYTLASDQIVGPDFDVISLAAGQII